MLDTYEGTLGPLVDTTVRVASWNLWWRFGPWEQRFEPIVATRRQADADVIALQEVWDADGRNQAAELADALGGYHHAYAYRFDFEGVRFGNAVLSRWPIADQEHQPLPAPDDEDEGRLVLRDVWELAPGEGPGHTWSNANPFAAAEAETPVRIDYISVAWPKAGGRGHAVSAHLLGDRPVDGVWPSDHFGVVTDLRY